MKNVPITDTCPESWKLSHYYDQLENYDSKEHLGYSYAYQKRKGRTLEAIQSLLKPGAKILDLAAAQGNFTLALAELGYEMTWNDLRGDLVDYVKQKYESGIVHYLVGNAFDLALEEVFDLVLIAEVIEHVAHPDEFLEKVSSLVKPGGYVVMTTPNGGYFRNELPRFSDFEDTSQFEAVQFQPDGDGHIFLLHMDEIYTLSQETSLEVEDIQIFTNPLTAGHVKTAPLLKILPKSFVDLSEQLTSLLPVTMRQRLGSHMMVVFKKS